MVLFLLDDTFQAAPWVLIIEDLSGGLELYPGSSSHRSTDSSIVVTAVPSAIDRLPYQLKIVYVSWQHALGPGDCGADQTLAVRLVEQVGLGIGSHTYSGALVLANHLAKCFPPNYWRRKRVLELGGGVGLLGILLATLGADVVTTDRPEYIGLM